MVKSGRRVGVFGGSFNPIHNGHLRLAEFAKSEFNLDKVLFVPTFRTPLKNREMMSTRLRLRCLREALKGRKEFAVSQEEIRRGGTSYTVDTLKALKRKLGPKTTLYFLAGADNARDFSRWKSPGKVLKLSRFTILSRPGSPLGARIARCLPAGRQVLWAPFPALKVSSTELRQRLSTGKSLKGLVPPRVERILKSAFKKN